MTAVLTAPKPPTSFAQDELCYALVGNPNTGKTSLFNALTGLRQKTANYPGVTIDQKCGECFSQHGKCMTVVDLPGAYSLIPRSPDEAICKDVLLGESPIGPKPNRLICIVDASQLQRQLYFVHVIAELGYPMIVVLNMMDVAAAQGTQIDVKGLETHLGVPVIPCQANKKEGIPALKVAMSQKELPSPQSRLEEAKKLETQLNDFSDDQDTTSLRKDYNGIIAKRHEWARRVYQDVASKTHEVKSTWTERLDRVVLHPIGGWFVLSAMMGLLFWSVFSLSTYPMREIEHFFTWLGSGVETLLPNGQIQSLIVNGIIAGVGNVLQFLPQILTLFFFLGLLESSGYLPRAVFLIDRVMNRVGLQGKSFIPLLSSYACAVPGIMATRTLSSREERLATIMIAPWMSCSARLPIYLLLIATMLPSPTTPAIWKAGVLLGAYFLGTAAAFLVGWVFRKTLLKSRVKENIMELPPYHMPSLKNTLMGALDRGKVFIQKAGTFILGFSIIFWFLTAYPRNDGLTQSKQMEQSYAGILGHAIEPAIKPLGYDWKIGVSVISSFAARELFVSTMGITFNVQHETPVDDCGCGCCGQSKEERSKLAGVLLAQTDRLGNRLYKPLTCLSLIVFYVFALQCTSTLVMTRRETGSLKWTAFQFGYMTITAYIAALLVYQIGTLLGF